MQRRQSARSGQRRKPCEASMRHRPPVALHEVAVPRQAPAEAGLPSRHWPEELQVHTPAGIWRYSLQCRRDCTCTIRCHSNKFSSAEASHSLRPNEAPPWRSEISCIKLLFTGNLYTLGLLRLLQMTKSKPACSIPCLLS